MENFETFGIIYLIICFILGIIQIIMIVKFFQIASDIKLLRLQLLKTKPDYKIDFYKWIAAQEPQKAKMVLINEIGNSAEFIQLLRGGNDKYRSELKDKILIKYRNELKIINLALEFNF